MPMKKKDIEKLLKKPIVAVVAVTAAAAFAAFATVPVMRLPSSEPASQVVSSTPLIAEP